MLPGVSSFSACLTLFYFSFYGRLDAVKLIIWLEKLLLWIIFGKLEFFLFYQVSTKVFLCFGPLAKHLAKYFSPFSYIFSRPLILEFLWLILHFSSWKLEKLFWCIVLNFVIKISVLSHQIIWNSVSWWLWYFIA